MLNHITEQHYLLSKQHSEFRDILEKHWQDETKRNAKLVAQVGEIKHEVVWLADEVRGDMLMNNAIEMARSGADAQYPQPRPDLPVALPGEGGRGDDGADRDWDRDWDRDGCASGGASGWRRFVGRASSSRALRCGPGEDPQRIIARAGHRSRVIETDRNDKQG